MLDYQAYHSPYALETDFSFEKVEEAGEGGGGEVLLLTTPENSITYHNTLCLSPHIWHKHCFQFLLGVK